MPKSYGETTGPRAPRRQATAIVPDVIALIIAWSASQPHRVGEVAFFPLGEWLLVGRGGDGLGQFAYFGQQRPGQEVVVDPREGLLGGDAVSRGHLRGCSDGDALEIHRVGRYPIYVNGQERERAVLHPGDTVLLENEVLLLCVKRPPVIALPPGGFELHRFGRPDANDITGESPGSWDLRAQIAVAAQAPAHVLVVGESGSGKELTARGVHRQSDRAQGPFVSDNASNFSTELISSELFGNPANYPNPGAPARKGLIGAADGGTLFLDEIGDCPHDVQTKLLRVMQVGEYRAVGEAIVRHADVRIIGATNQHESVMRKEFFARFQAHVHVPTLRDRREDIPLIIRHFVIWHAQQFPKLGGDRFLRTGPDGQLEPKIDVALVDHLVRHPLSLNTRELQGILIKAIGTSRGDELTLPTGRPQPAADASPARPASILPAPATGRGPVPLGPPPKEEVIACLGVERNISKAAKALGITRQALYELMERYGIKKE